MAANKKISQLANVPVSLSGTELVPVVQDGVTLRTTAQAIADLAGGGGGVGSVTSVSVVNANGVSGAVATPTTTPAITLSLDATGVTAGSYTLANITVNAAGQVTAAANGSAGGAGTVTSVAATVPDFLSIAGSPITTSGTLAISYSGTALPIANGGTGLTALGAGVQAWLATPSSANLAAATTDETGSGSLVFGTSPTLANPVVGTQAPGNNTTLAASTAFVTAAVSAAGGGTVTSFVFTNGGGFTGNVTNASTTPTLALTLDPTGVTAGTYSAANITVNAAGQITLASSSGGLPAIPLDFKDSADLATTANITLSGEQTIDGVLTTGSRVLVKDQTTGSANGIYVSAAGAWTRSTDADVSAEVTSGMLIYVEAGTVSGGLIYTLSTPDPITLGTTALTFVTIVLPFSFFVGKTVSTTTYTHILTDAGKRLNCTNAGTKTITVAPQGTVNSAVNTEIEVFNAGAGLLTVAPGAGVTINSLGGVLTIPQFHCMRLKKRANPNTWDLTGIGAAGVTGTGSLVYSTSPALVTPALGTPTALVLTNATGLTVPGGGTGVALLTAYAPLFGGTTSTGAIQSGTVGTAGQVLTSNGAAALATMQSPPFVAAFNMPGVPTASQFLGVFVAPSGIVTLTAAAAIAGSSGKALVAATAQTDVDVRKNATTAANGTSVGTVRWAAAGTVPTFIAASGFTLTGGTDYLTFWAPATPDATLAFFGATLYLTR